MDRPALLPTPQCVHCGFCLPACPTYDVLGTEMDSPRGRLHLMAALQQGRIEPSAAVVRHLDLCLGCRACETACPSGVPYGRHLEEARERLVHSPARPPSERRTERLVLLGLRAPPSVQRLGLRLLRWAARGGLRRFVPGAALLAASAGGTASSPRPAEIPRVTPPAGRRRMRVGLLLGCVQRWLFGDVNAAAARLLSLAGCEVVVPPEQGCCGALHAHAGDLPAARRLARRNLAAFEMVGRLDAVVVTAAGCGALLKDYGQLLADDPRWSSTASAFARRTRDALEILDELGLPAARREVRRTVAYHDACHLAHAQRVREGPRRLLASLPGLELLPLAESDRCCGSAGLYNLLHPEVADALLDRKLDRLLASGAEVVAAANPGCLLHLSAGLLRRGMSAEARHPLLLLDEACR